MRPLKFFLAGAFISSLLGLVACTPAAGAPSSVPPAPTELSSMLTLNLALEQTQYQLGVTVNAIVTLQNVGAEAVVVNQRLAIHTSVAPPELQELSFIVTRPSGTRSQYEALVQIRGPKTQHFVSLGPNEPVKKTVALNPLYAITEPGLYTVQAIYASHAQPSDGRVAWQGELQSNVVAFEVLP